MAQQRQRVDWEAAEAFYLGLAPPQRHYGAVARQFRVSETSVGKHARRRQWIAKAADIDQQAGASAQRKALRTREQRVEQALRVADLVIDQAHDDLANGKVRASYERVPEFVKLAELLVGQATNRSEIRAEHVTAGFRTLIVLAGRHMVADARDAFLVEAEEAIGSLMLEAGAGEQDA